MFAPRSDSSVAHQGFRLTWNSTERVCGGSLTGETRGVVTSPGWPGRYPHQADCSWVIRYLPAYLQNASTLSILSIKLSILSITLSTAACRPAPGFSCSSPASTWSPTPTAATTDSVSRYSEICSNFSFTYIVTLIILSHGDQLFNFL